MTELLNLRISELNEKLTTSNDRTVNGCARCGSRNIRRSARYGFRDRVVSFLGLRPYRCGRCYRRFYAGPALTEQLMAVADTEPATLQIGRC